MISDFICEEIGYLRLTDDQFQEYQKLQASKPELEVLDSPKARVVFEYGKNRNGYWGHEHMSKQIKKAIAIHDFIFPEHQAVFVLDNSSGHLAFAPDALVASKMNVNPDGAQPALRETIWNGAPQVIGKCGLKAVLFFFFFFSSCHSILLDCGRTWINASWPENSS
eukprot:Pompholyxophrys_punicea_v1_NODE_802_length_1271_cov_14.558824.p1 type:complete len:166 gc:universal NODE_802_length_1271_cov_14.558824:71-568(+)